MKMKRDCRCYKVVCQSTSTLKTSVRIKDEQKNASYAECENAILYIVTDKPQLIHEWLGHHIKSIEDVGCGYYPIEDADHECCGGKCQSSDLESTQELFNQYRHEVEKALYGENDVGTGYCLEQMVRDILGYRQGADIEAKRADALQDAYIQLRTAVLNSNSPGMNPRDKIKELDKMLSEKE